MKKAITILLAAALLLSLAACGGGNGVDSDTNSNVTPVTTTETTVMSMEEMLEAAQEAKTVDIGNEYAENKVKAMEKYAGNIFKITDYVYFIESDYCRLGNHPVQLRVYFPKEILLELNDGKRITIVGKIDDEIGIEENIEYFAVKDCYLVTDNYEITGTLKQKGIDNNDELYIVLELENGGENYIYFEKSVIDELKEGDIITATGKMTYTSSDYRAKMIDAQLVR